MWEIIPRIGTGVSLAAFIVAVILTGYAVRWRNRLREIKEIPEAERARFLAAQAEFFNIDLSRIPQKDRAQIIIEQIRIKANREKYTAIIFAIVALSSFSVALVELVMNSADHRNKPEQMVVDDNTIADLKDQMAPKEIDDQKADNSAQTQITYSADEYSNDLERFMGWSNGESGGESYEAFPHTIDKFPDSVKRSFNIEAFETFPVDSTAKIKENASLGYMNVRSWPGDTGRILFKAPAGYDIEKVRRCISPRDIAAKRWCEILTSMGSGWVSEIGIEWP